MKDPHKSKNFRDFLRMVGFLPKERLPEVLDMIRDAIEGKQDELLDKYNAGHISLEELQKMMGRTNRLKGQPEAQEGNHVDA